MSNEAIAWAYKQKIQNPARKFLLVALADFADEAWSCYPGQERLGEMTGQSVSTVRRHLNWLEESGYITRTRRFDAKGHRTSDRFVLNHEESLPVNLTSGQIPTGQNVIPTGQKEQSYRSTVNEEPLVEPSDIEPPERVRAKRGTRIDENWMPEAQTVDAIKEELPGIDVASEHRKFVDHFLANGKTMKDWNAAWRNWMRRSRPASSRTNGASRADEKVRNYLDIGRRLTSHQKELS